MSIWDIIAGWFRPWPPRPRPPQPVPVPNPPGPSRGGLSVALLEATNAARREHGLPLLRPSSALDAAAAQHAYDMAVSGVMSHAGFPERLTAAGYTYAAAAENVAAGQPDAEAVVDAWILDPPHRANLLGPYEACGGSGAQARGGMWFWCADYATPSDGPQIL